MKINSGANREMGPSTVRQSGQRENNLLQVFMAEDSLANQTIARYFINKLGHHLTIAKNGMEAEKMLSQSKFDIIFMDIQMPFKNGYEITTELRESSGPNSKAPVIAITAHSMSGEEEKCLAAGMDDYITKPIRLGEFGRMLNKWTK